VVLAAAFAGLADLRVVVVVFFAALGCAFRATAFDVAFLGAAFFGAAFVGAAFLEATGPAVRFAALFRLAVAAPALRAVADFFVATLFRGAALALPDRAVLRLRLLVRVFFRFAITRSFPDASDPRLTLTVPGK
jgi:hypothetical protein